MGRILDRYINGKVLRQWRRTDQLVGQASFSELRKQRDQARVLKHVLERVLQKVDGQLIRPLVAADQFPKPLGTDWSWRPGILREPLARPGISSPQRKAKMDPQVTMFHNCDRAEITLRQIRSYREKDLTPYNLSLETFGFGGSFVSLSIELPDQAAAGLTKQHLMRVDLVLEPERPTPAFARLNIQHGPNSEQVLRALDLSSPAASVDFDLAHLHLNERRIEKLWLDLIFEQPAMNKILLRDLTFCRHFRADL